MMKRLFQTIGALCALVAFSVAAQIGSPMMGTNAAGVASGSSPSFNNVTATGQFFAANGAIGAPSYAFTSQPALGIYRAAVSTLSFTDGVDRFWVSGANILMPSIAVFGWTSGVLGTGIDVSLVRDAAAVLALKNGTTAQAFRIYGTTTGPKYLSISHDGTNGVIDVSAASGFLKVGGNATSVQPSTNGTIDLGAGTVGYKRLYVDFTNTGTIGAVTINKAAGRVNVAAAAATVTVTNSLATAASAIFATAAANDATCGVKNAVPAAGSFVINMTANCTANTAISFFIVNTD